MVRWLALTTQPLQGGNHLWESSRGGMKGYFCSASDPPAEVVTEDLFTQRCPLFVHTEPIVAGIKLLKCVAKPKAA